MSTTTFGPKLLDKKSQLPTLRLTDTPRATKWIGWALFVCLLVLPVVLLFVPWTQNVTGSGQIVAYVPVDRPQKIRAPIKGVVKEWKVVEGSKVKKGALLAMVSDLDPEFTDRLEQQLQAAEDKIIASEAKALAYNNQVTFFTDSKKNAVTEGLADIAEAEAKVKSTEQEIVAAEADFSTAQINFNRSADLFPKGLISRRDYELAELKFNETKAKVTKLQNDLEANKESLESKKAKLEKVKNEADAKIKSAEALARTAESELASAKDSLQKARIDFSRADAQEIRAPRDGTVLRLIANSDGGDQVKQGDPIMDFVPDAKSLAVELYVSGNDMPLIRDGQHVRLQFEGFPAVQFAGWPSVAQGTFGGQVTLVDASDNGYGRFRILIVPDDEDGWPAILRQGQRANGWVLLNEVSLGFELWRQLNGFPPALDYQGTQDGKLKPEKMRLGK